MNYFVLLLILIGFVAISSGTAYGIWIPETPEGLLEQSDTVFVGTITSVKVLEFQRTNTYNAEENGVSRIIVENYTQSLDQYTVNIEEFLKNPQKSHTITMLEATVSGLGISVSIGGFELGDRVLFYIPKLDGTNQYSPESFKIPKSCDARDVIAEKRLQMGEDFAVTQDGIKVDYGNFTANKPIEFVFSKDVGTLDGKSFDVGVVISKYVDKKLKKPILNQEIHAESKLCEWLASAKWGFTPEKGDYAMSLSIKQNNSTGYQYSGFSVKSDISNNLQSPLKQFKSGTFANKIICKEGLQLVINGRDHPACIKNSSLETLSLRNYVSEEIIVGIPDDLPRIDDIEIQSMFDLFKSRYHISNIDYVGKKIIIVATNYGGDGLVLEMQSINGKVISTLTCNHMDWRNQEVITENVLDYLQNKNCFNPALEETRK